MGRKEPWVGDRPTEIVCHTRAKITISLNTHQNSVNGPKSRRKAHGLVMDQILTTCQSSTPQYAINGSMGQDQSLNPAFDYDGLFQLTGPSIGQLTRVILAKLSMGHWAGDTCSNEQPTIGYHGPIKSDMLKIRCMPRCSQVSYPIPTPVSLAAIHYGGCNVSVVSRLSQPLATKTAFITRIFCHERAYFPDKK